MATGLVTILGSGGSGGVPLVSGYWGACDPNNPKNKRLRASIAVNYKDTCVVVDTGPDFRAQTLLYGVRDIDAILYTHAHSDHVNGVDELRYLRYIQGHDIDVYGDLDTLSSLQSRFAHMFMPTPDGLYKPVVNPIAFRDDEYTNPKIINDLTFTPFFQAHGPSGRSVGYRFGDFAYSTDVSDLSEAAFDVLAGIKTWVVDCCQYGSDIKIVHPDFDMVKSWNDRIGAGRVILTHLTPRLDYDTLMAELPQGYEVAYDGQTLEFNL